MKLNVIGVPLFYGSDRVGVQEGPNTLRDHGLLDILSLHSKREIYDSGNLYVEDVEIDAKYTMHNKMKYLKEIITVNKNLANSVFNSLNANSFPFVVGGDHSLGLGSVAGASKYFGEDFGVIWIDAHGDINTDVSSPTGNVHGMPLAASIGIGPKELKNIYFDGVKVKPSNIFILCARDLDKGELELIQKHDLSVWTTSQIKEIGVSKALEELLIKIKNINNIHLSFDIDCLDAELVPGTGTPVTDGMELNEIKYLLQGILSTKKIKSMDFVEFNPFIDKDNKTLNNCIDLLNLIAKEL
ncbi:arginase [Clostridium cavendishii DSM 21758]|uniref:Arginase n=1 Tax=Clostridium cavendishii DSM 21758 TaxID=1121302 RepID=A0A1M6F4M0_9CLOT|nr:arginase [Clostridium cavendishii]SHI92602.1 arginase [Clostridium cavendishii DSM 21758]